MISWISPPPTFCLSQSKFTLPVLPSASGTRKPRLPVGLIGCSYSEGLGRGQLLSELLSAGVSHLDSDREPWQMPLPPLDYLNKIQNKGLIYFNGKKVGLFRIISGQPVACAEDAAVA